MSDGEGMLIFSEDQVRRYSRQMILPEIGGEGQRRLLESKALIVGLGDFALPLIYYLAGAGVGTLGLADPDLVEQSHLYRGILHRMPDLGRLKIESAGEAIARLNSGIQVRLYQEKLTEATIANIITDYDIVVGGADDHQARYLINDACVRTRIPHIHGSISGVKGEVASFHPPEGACYRCLYPDPLEADLPPNGQGSRLLTPFSGIIGSVQAVETIKTLLGIGELPGGSLLHLNSLTMEVGEVVVQKNPSCPICYNNYTMELS